MRLTAQAGAKEIETLPHLTVDFRCAPWTALVVRAGPGGLAGCVPPRRVPHPPAEGGGGAGEGPELLGLRDHRRARGGPGRDVPEGRGGVEGGVHCLGGHPHAGRLHAAAGGGGVCRGEEMRSRALAAVALVLSTGCYRMTFKFSTASPEAGAPREI